MLIVLLPAAGGALLLASGNLDAQDPPPAAAASRYHVPIWASDPERRQPPAGGYLIGQVKSETVAARRAPTESSDVVASFAAVTPEGVPQVFLLAPEKVDHLGMLPPGVEWVRALLPIRPNGTMGYLPVRDLDLTTTPYRVIVDRKAFELTVWEGPEIFMRVPVGIGKGKTPTPRGHFYLASLLRPPRPDSVYGTYAYGLSGYSETLLDWRNGGIIGIHGTNDPTSVGRAVSHGCVRMRNEHIEQLVPLLPLGTPVEIK